MVREVDHHQYHSSGGGVTLSSIALLQERFRQLEKMKELRQEKELLRMLSESSERYSPPPIIHYNEPKHDTKTSSCLGGPEIMMMFVPPKQHHECQLSLSLSWPDNYSPTKHADSRGMINIHTAPSNNSSNSKSWFVDHAPLVSTQVLANKIGSFDDHSDIDTSLRL